MVEQFGLVSHRLVGRWLGLLIDRQVVGRWLGLLVDRQVGLGCEEPGGNGEVEGIGLGDLGLDGPRRKQVGHVGLASGLGILDCAHQTSNNSRTELEKTQSRPATTAVTTTMVRITTTV